MKSIAGKPKKVNSRNASFDQFIAEMVLLKNELRAIGSNLNQITKKINSQPKAPSMKLIMDGYRLTKESIDSKISVRISAKVAARFAFKLTPCFAAN